MEPEYPWLLADASPEQPQRWRAPFSVVNVRSANGESYAMSTAITHPAHVDNIKKNRALGNLAILPQEIRNDIYSRILGDDYRQVYTFDQHGLTRDHWRSSPDPPFLNVNPILRKELLSALTSGRICTLRIEEHSLITNAPLHDPDTITSPIPPAEASQTFAIPTCKRIDITIDPPSPRDCSRFHTLRRNVHTLIDLINRRARDLNPQICVELDRATGLQTTSSYNDFAMFFGPFVHLAARCKAVMLFRTTGLPCFFPTVERYCNLIEAAMRFVPAARRELLLHQCQIDVKLAVARLRLNDPWAEKYKHAPKSVPMGDVDFAITKFALAVMYRLFNDAQCEMPRWIQDLTRHFVQAQNPRRLPDALQAAVMGGHSQQDMKLWAAGLIARFNPFFDDTKFFAGEQSMEWTESL